MNIHTTFRRRTALSGCVLFFVTFGLVSVWLIGGLPMSYQVEGGSMALTLLGTHRELVCEDCGRRFVCDADAPANARACCPNCGYPDNRLESISALAGDRVLIDRTAFVFRAPRRWETIAFRRPDRADQIAIKRVVGLPGESIELRDGDVFVNNVICRKDLPQQRDLAVLVHDAAFAPDNPAAPPRWRPASPHSRWITDNGQFTYNGSAEEHEIDWLVYRHWRRQAASDDKWGFQDSPITDVCSYNLQPRRTENVHPVTDVMLKLRLIDVSGRGMLCFRAGDGRDRFETRLNFDGKSTRYQTFHNGQLLPDAAGEITWFGSDNENEGGTTGNARAGAIIEVSLFDRQYILAVNGHLMAACPYDRPAPPRRPTHAPLVIGARGICLTVRDVKVYRDVYYTDSAVPAGSSGDFGPKLLLPHQYYVLGDNSPVSADSRTWPEGGVVEDKLFLGKPLAAIPTVSVSFLAGWSFQVPNPMEMRYIR